MATIEDTQASNRLSERLRSGLALAQTRIQNVETRAKNQWTDLPVQLRAVVDRAVARLRTTLDLPSRSEVSELVERLEAIDRKIVALEKRQGKRGAQTAATASAAQDESGQTGADAETSAPVEAADGAEPSVEQRADSAEAEPEASDDAAPETSGEARAGGKATARKTVKPTSAGKTVKAGSNAARGPETRGDSTQARARKKGHRNGHRS